MKPPGRTSRGWWRVTTVCGAAAGAWPFTPRAWGAASVSITGWSPRSCAERGRRDAVAAPRLGVGDVMPNVGGRPPSGSNHLDHELHAMDGATTPAIRYEDDPHVPGA